MKNLLSSQEGSFLPAGVCRRVHVRCCGFLSLRLVYSLLPVSLDCGFLIGPSVFSNVYLLHVSECLMLAPNEHFAAKSWCAKLQFQEMITMFIL